MGASIACARAMPARFSQTARYVSAHAVVFLAQPSYFGRFMKASAMPPLESMACGTPVIASRVSSLPEVLGAAAMTVNPENVFDIARGIREVILEPEIPSRVRAPQV